MIVKKVITIEIDTETKAVSIMHPEWGVTSSAKTIKELHWIVNEAAHYMVQYIGDDLFPWDGKL